MVLDALNASSILDKLTGDALVQGTAAQSSSAASGMRCDHCVANQELRRHILHPGKAVSRAVDRNRDSTDDRARR